MTLPLVEQAAFTTAVEASREIATTKTVDDKPKDDEEEDLIVCLLLLFLEETDLTRTDCVISGRERRERKRERERVGNAIGGDGALENSVKEQGMIHIIYLKRLMSRGYHHLECPLFITAR